MASPLRTSGGSHDLQDPQSLPHRVAANAKLFCKDPLRRQFGAYFEIPGPDLLLDVVNDTDVSTLGI